MERDINTMKKKERKGKKVKEEGELQIDRKGRKEKARRDNCEMRILD